LFTRAAGRKKRAASSEARVKQQSCETRKGLENGSFRRLPSGGRTNTAPMCLRTLARAHPPAPPHALCAPTCAAHLRAHAHTLMSSIRFEMPKNRTRRHFSGVCRVVALWLVLRPMWWGRGVRCRIKEIAISIIRHFDDRSRRKVKPLWHSYRQ